MASSRLIAAGETYTPDDINNLRADVLDPVGGHKHTGVDGAKVPFSNLDVSGAAGSTAPAGGSKGYNDIANHVASSQGVHGLNASVFALGGLASGLLVQSGNVPAALSGSSTDPNHEMNGTVTFANTGVSFSAPPIVVAQIMGSRGVDTGIALSSITANGFNWRVNTRYAASTSSFNWIAIGAKAA